MTNWQPQDLIEGPNHARHDPLVRSIAEAPEHVPPHETRRVERMIDQEFSKHRRHGVDALEPKLHRKLVFPEPLAELTSDHKPQALLDAGIIVRRQRRPGISKQARVVGDDDLRIAHEVHTLGVIPGVF